MRTIPEKHTKCKIKPFESYRTFYNEGNWNQIDDIAGRFFSLYCKFLLPLPMSPYSYAFFLDVSYLL